MRRCPRCAEKVQSAAVVCRYCDHAFAEQDQWGEIADVTNRAVKWCISAAVAVVLAWLAYGCVMGAAIDQAQRGGAGTEQH